MKKLSTILLSCLLLLAAAADAQTVQIGTGTNIPPYTLYGPLYRYTATSATSAVRCDMMWTQAEMTAAGIPSGAQITAIQFNKTNVANFVTPASLFTIMMYNSSITGLATTQTWAAITSTFTTVFTSTSYNVPSAAGWVNMPVTPFTYTGGTLEIATEVAMIGNGGATDGFKWEYTSTTPTTYIVGVSNNTSATLNGGVAGYKWRPNIKITYTAPSTGPATLTGTQSVCVGGTTTFTGTPAGGTYSSGTTSVATVNSTTGAVLGVAAGASVITYTSGSQTATRTVTVNALPTAPNTITGTATVCVGSTTQFSSTTTGGTWTSSNTAVATVSSTGLVSGLTAGSSTITYSVTNAAGCSASATRSVTVSAIPTVAAITGTTTVCASGTTALANATSGGTWSSSNTAVATVNNSGLVSGVSAGTAVISYTVTSGGCSAVATASVSVATASTTPGPITGGTALCSGAISQLGNTVSGGNWTSNNSTIASVSSNGVVTGVSAGTATITYTIGTTGCTASTTTSVTITATPTVGTITGNTSMCSGSASALNIAATGGTWASSNTAVATVSTSGVVSALAAGNANVTYTVTNGGCSAMATAPVTVSTAPPAPPAITGNTAFCTGTTGALAIAVTGGGWSSSNTSVATISSTGIVTGLTPGTATITYMVINGAGCTATSTSSITVNPTPQAPAAITGSSTVCQESSAMLSSATPGGTWTSGNTSVATISPTGVVSGVSAGTTTISYIISASGCSSDTAMAITIHPAPVAVVTVSGLTLSTGMFPSYQWLRNDQPINGATNSSYTATQNGNYKVIVTNSLGCTDSSEARSVTNVGIHHTAGGPGIRIYPNPASTKLHIDAPQDVHIIIAAMDGKTVLTDHNTKQIDVSQVADGLYIIRLTDINGKLLDIQKFTKTH